MSIFNYIDLDTCIADIFLQLSKKDVNVVVVEGSSDSTCLSNFFDSKVNFIESPHYGKIGVQEIISKAVDELGDKHKRCIGIIDRDYGKATDIENLFYYDYCCMDALIKYAWC